MHNGELTKSTKFHL